MPKRSATAKERRHIARVKAMPCGLCGAPGPSDAHHVRTGQGMGQRASHWLLIPLCKACHQDDEGLHGSRALWRVYRKDELDVLAETIERIAA